ncbi:hypothetical protein [Curtobacterium herbarum]|uniref:Histidinol dehydrogenase n=1 Tax=Curtobacterium herbarum TaxID=150122 RepID=A0ABN1ZEK0_9MICO|nr:hypothetical protein [Curtobacterium herbarum]MBM7474590.1 hypothetical protein [Curtobacterium herbarum]MCS6545245.1 hypothetical protein [Curtobacterium herbarum]
MTRGDSDGSGRTGTGPWPHALLAAAVGAVAAQFTHGGAVAVLLTGLPGLLVLVMVTVMTGGALAVCAVLGTGARRFAWLGTTALLVVPAVLVVDAVLFMRAGPSGSPDGGFSTAPLLWVIGAVLAAVPALLVHVTRPDGASDGRGWP